MYYASAMHNGVIFSVVTLQCLVQMFPLNYPQRRYKIENATALTCQYRRTLHFRFLPGNEYQPFLEAFLLKVINGTYDGIEVKLPEQNRKKGNHDIFNVILPDNVVKKKINDIYNVIHKLCVFIIGYFKQHIRVAAKEILNI